jgi:uncharacterized protein YebE (UPF0316 family)
MGTVRTIMVVRGYRLLSAVIGFFEVIIWILAAGQVLKHLDQWYLIVAYAGGFAMGNTLGIWIESKLALGQVLVQAISENLEISLAENLRQHGYTVTEMSGIGAKGVHVEIVLIAETRRDLVPLLTMIRQIDPKAFYAVSDTRSIYGAIIPYRPRRGWMNGWRSIRKRK